MYGSYAELVAAGVDPNHLLGLVTNEEDKDQFLIRDDERMEDEGMYRTVLV